MSILLHIFFLLIHELSLNCCKNHELFYFCKRTGTVIIKEKRDKNKVDFVCAEKI